MTAITISFFIISFALLNFSLISILYYNLFTNDTAYFILSNSILLISILLFYYYFSDYYLSLIFTFLTLINSICMSLELKKISLKHFLLSIPYFIFLISSSLSYNSSFSNLSKKSLKYLGTSLLKYIFSLVRG